MANNANIKINVNTQQVTLLDRMIQKLFGAQRPNAFNQQLQATNRALDVQRAHMQSLLQQLGQVQKGTHAFKALQQAIRDTGSEISRLGRIQSYQAAEIKKQQQAAATASANALSTQVANAAAYGGSAAMRGAGAMGRLAGRTASGASSVMTGGVGGLAAAMSALPWGLGAAGGLLMSAASHYGTALEFQRARMGADAFLASSRGSRDFQGGSLVDWWAANKAPVGPDDTWAVGTGPMGAYGLGARFGLDPTAVINQASAMSQAAGRPVRASEFAGALAIQQRYGVSTETSGGLLHASKLAGGDSNMQLVADMIGEAVAGRLEGSDIAALLSEQSSWLQGLFQQGLTARTEGVMQTAANLRASGVSNTLMAYNAARAFGGGVAGMAFTGPQSGMDLRLMRAAGFTGTGGWEEFSRIKMRMQDAGQASLLLGPLLKKNLDGIKGPWMRANIVQQTLAAYGARIDAKSAYRIGQGFETGEINRGNMSNILTEAFRSAENAAPAVLGEAALGAQRIEAGSKVAPAMLDLESAAVQTTLAFEDALGPAVRDVAWAMDGLAVKISEFTRSLPNSTPVRRP